MGKTKVYPDAAERVRAACAAAGLSDQEITAGLRLDGRPSLEADPEALRACLRALYDARLSVGCMAQGSGWTRHEILTRLEAAGLCASDRFAASTLPGEAWRKIPGWAYDASNLGRVRSRKGRKRLIKPYMAIDRPRVRIWGSDEDPNARREIAVASAVLAAFRGVPVSTPAKHLNGDMTDCRLSNIQADRPRHRLGKIGGDAPWSPEEDRIVRAAANVSEVVQKTGRSWHHAKRRMEELGIKRTVRKQARVPLGERDIPTLQRAVAALETAGVPDRQINRALGIFGEVNRGQSGMPEAVDRCVIALWEAGFARKEIAAAFGWKFGTVCKHIIRLGLAESRYAPGSYTVAGAPDAVPGEVWKPHPWGYQVSNMGRVLGKRGDLLSQDVGPAGGMKVALRHPDGHQTTAMVAALVLAAFKPEMPYSQRRSIYLNGDKNDPRLANLVAARQFDGPIAAKAVRQGKNTQPSHSHVPYLDPLWQEAAKAVPSGLEPDVRDDLISDMVVMMIEGEATDMKAAFRLARTRYNQMMGTFRERSLDAPIAGTEGLTMLDKLASG
jgi:hypothetical protein